MQKTGHKIAVLDVLGIVPFRSLWLGQLFSQIGINLLTFVLALQAYNLTSKNTAVSILTLSFIVPQALFGSIAGVIVDRYDKKIVLYLCNLSRAGIVLLFLLSAETLPLIYLLAIIISLITQFFVPAEAPTIPRLVPKDKIMTANGVFTMTIFVTMLLGGVLAGPLLDMVGLRPTIIFVFFVYLLASFNISQIPGQPIAEALKRRIKLVANFDLNNFFNHGAGQKMRQEFREGKDYVLSHHKILLAILLLVGSQTVLASFSTLLPGFADKILHIPINDASVKLLGPAILGIVSGAVIVSQFGNKFPPQKAIPVGVFFAGVFIILLGLTDNLLLAQLFLLLLGFSNALVDVSCNTILQSQADENIHSRVYGVLTALGGLIFILPVIASGTMSDVFGVNRVFLGFGVIILLIFLKVREKAVIL